VCVCVSVCIHMWWVSSFHALLGWVHGRLWLEADEAGTDPCMQENKTFPERKTTEHTHAHTHTQSPKYRHYKRTAERRC